MGNIKAKAVWDKQVIAESNHCLDFDNNIYFPHESINKEFFHKSKSTTICGWKGEASYYDVIIADHKNPSAAWYYQSPKEKAHEIKGMVAFWNGVEIEVIEN